MDPVKSSSEVRKSEGDDLSVLFYKSGKSLKNLSTSVGRGIHSFGNAVLLTLLFLLRNFLWLILGTGLGFGYGFYLMSANGMSYHSEMMVKANFNSATSLYNTLDYINALIHNGKTAELSKMFGISEADAKKLKSFSAEAIKSETSTSEMYKERYLKVTRGNTIRQDTFWLRALTYEDFKESLSKYDYPYHTVSVVASNPAIFGHLEQGIIAHISNNDLLQEIKAKAANSNREEEELLVSSINKLDTLRRAYNQRLMRGQSTTTPSGNQLTVVDASPITKTPELDLYDKMLQLNEELKSSRTKSITEQDIIEVLSPFNPMGQRISFFQQNVARYSLVGFVVALIILLSIALYKFLLSFEKRYKAKKRALLQENPNL